MPELDELLTRLEAINSGAAGKPTDEKLYKAPEPTATPPDYLDSLEERLTGVYEQSRRDRGEEHGYLETVGKGLVRGAEGIASGVGSIGTWAGEATGIEPLAKAGKWTSEYFDKAAREGWAAPDPVVFKGSFMDRPSLKRAAGIVSEALPSLAAALFTGGVAAGGLRAAGVAAGAAQKTGAAAGAFGLGGLEGAPIYEEARKAGKSIGEASALGGAATIGTGLLEFLPISRMLKPMAKGGFGKAALKAVELGGEEAAQEGTQQIFQNAIARYGYDATRDLTEGIVESIIGGFGSGAIAGTTSSRINRWIEDRRKQGIPDEQISNDIDQIGNAVADDMERHADNVTQAPVTDEITRGADAILQQAETTEADPEDIIMGRQATAEEIPPALQRFTPAPAMAPAPAAAVEPQSRLDELYDRLSAVQRGEEPAQAPAPAAEQATAAQPIETQPPIAPAELQQGQHAPVEPTEAAPQAPIAIETPAPAAPEEQQQPQAAAPTPEAAPAEKTTVKRPASLDVLQEKYIRGRIEKLGSLEAVKKVYSGDTTVEKYARALAEEQFGGKPAAAAAAPDESKTDKIKSAYDALKSERGMSNIEIADIRDKAGVTQAEMEGYLRRQGQAGNSVTTGGDRAVVDDHVKSGAVYLSREDRPDLLARIDKAEEAAGEAVAQPSGGITIETPAAEGETVEAGPTKPVSGPREAPVKPGKFTGTAGWAFIGDQQRPITAAREITKGKNKGKFLVTVGNEKRQRMIPADAIKKMPVLAAAASEATAHDKEWIKKTFKGEAYSPTGEFLGQLHVEGDIASIAKVEDGVVKEIVSQHKPSDFKNIGETRLSANQSVKKFKLATEAAASEPDLTYKQLNQQVKDYQGKGGISSEAKGKGLIPAFKDNETGRTYEAKDSDGNPAGVHLLDGLPADVVTQRNDQNEPIAVKGSIVPGFLKDGKFYTRDEATKLAEATKTEAAPVTEKAAPAPQEQAAPKSWFNLGKTVAQEYTNEDKTGKTTVLKPDGKILRAVASRLGIKPSEAYRSLEVYNSEDPRQTENRYKNKPVPDIASQAPVPKSYSEEMKARADEQYAGWKGRETAPETLADRSKQSAPKWAALTPEQREAVAKQIWATRKGNLSPIGRKIAKSSWDKLSPAAQRLISGKILGEEPAAAQQPEAHPEPKAPKQAAINPAPAPKASKITTLRGRIMKMGGINAGNMKGELKDVTTGTKFLLKKTGEHLDLAERTLREEGWLREDENLVDVLRDPANLRRNKVAGEGVEKREQDKTEAEKRFEREMNYEQEEPPPGDYVMLEAEDLPEGKKLTIIDDSAAGWDVYTVEEKDPFGVTLKDGRTIELKPGDQVQVRKEDLPEKAQEKAADSEPSGARAPAGGTEGVNGYFYKGGQFLPSTEAPPGTFKREGKGSGSGKELIEPGVAAEPPTPESRSILRLSGIGSFTTIDEKGKLVFNPNQNVAKIDDVIRPGIRGNVYDTEITIKDLIDRYNAGDRWLNLGPKLVRAEAPAAAEAPKKETQKIVSEYDRELERLGLKYPIEAIKKFGKDSQEYKDLRELQETVGEDLLEEYRKIHPTGAIVLENKDKTNGYIITKSAKESGRWQATSWDERGFSGDMSFKSEAEAIKEIAGMGYDIDARDKFAEVSKTDKFLNGVLEAEKIQKEHRERMLQFDKEAKAEEQKTAEKPDFTRTINWLGKEVEVPYFVINKEVALHPSAKNTKVIHSVIKTINKGNYRISVIENEEGERYANVEKGSDENGSLSRVDVRFEWLPSGQWEDVSSIRSAAESLYKQFPKEQPSLFLQGEKQMPAAQAELRTRGKKLGQAQQGGLEFGLDKPPAELSLTGERVGAKEALAAKKIMGEAAKAGETTITLPAESEFVPSEEVSKWERDHYIKDGGTFESSRKKPMQPYPWKEGAWRIDNAFGPYGRMVEQIRRVKLSDLALSEEDYTKVNFEGRGFDAEQYAQWMKEGKAPPPVLVVETDSGGLLTSDGHRRVAAAKLAGVDSILAWVSPRMDTGKKDSAGKPIYTAATYEGLKFGAKRAQELYEQRLDEQMKKAKAAEKSEAKVSKEMVGKRVTIAKVAHPELPHHAKNIGKTGVVEKAIASRNEYTVRLDDGGTWGASPGNIEEVKAKEPEKPVSERDTFSVDRLNKETGKWEPISFQRGETVKAWMNSGEYVTGEISGISKAKNTFKVGQVEFPFGAAYKTEQPQPKSPKQPTAPLSKIVEKSNIKNAPAGGWEKPSDKITDSGEELWYNKRNRMGGGIKWDDVKDLNPTLKTKEVTKQKVWPRPDYAQLIDEGMPSFAAHIVKQAYDAIPNNPTFKTDEDLKFYIEEMQRVRESIFKWAKDSDSVRALLQKLTNQASVYAGAVGGKPISISSMSSSASAIRAEGMKLFDAVYPGFESRDFYPGNKYHDSGRMFGRKFIKVIQPGMDEAQRAVKALTQEGWPGKAEAWQKQGFKVLDRDDSVKIKEWRDRVDGKDVPRFYVEPDQNRGTNYNTREEAEAAIAAMKPYLLVSKGSRVLSQHDTKEAAEEAARGIVKKKDRGGKITDFRIEMSAATREGTKHRAIDEDITPDRLRETFGFKGVNFGNWTNQSERQASTNAAYDAFMDLAEMLGVPPKALSLNGMLGVAFGAQGTGAHGAHFVPGVNEINLTKTKGAGALAHEWAHAVDHHFATQAGLGRSKAPWLSAHEKAGDGVRPEIADAFRKIMTSIRKRPATAEEIERMKIERDGRSIMAMNTFIAHIRQGLRMGMEGKPATDIESALKEYDDLAERLRSGDTGEGYAMAGKLALPQTVAQMRVLVKDKAPKSSGDLADNWKGLASWASTIAYGKKNKEANKAHVPQMVQTDYAKGALALDKEKKGKIYWTDPTELFARAFETYVVDRLKTKARRNDYLSYPMQDEEKQRYPEGSERTAINEAFETLVGSIQTKETDKGVTMLNMGAAPGTSVEGRGLGATKQNVERIQQLVPVVERAMRTAGLPQEVIDRVRVDLKPIIDLRGKDIEQSLADWAKEGKQMDAILGATTMRKWSALMELSLEQDLNSLEKTTFHEAFHIAAEWMLPAEDYKRVLSHYRTSEGAADSFADFVSRRSGGQPAPVGVVRRALIKLRNLLQQVGSWLRGQGLTSPEDIFGKLARGEYAPHFGRGQRTTTALQAEKRAPVWYSQMEKFLAAKLPGSGTAKSYMAPIESWARKGEFKAEELEWSGLKDWLAEQSGKVTKQQVLDYLAANNVRVQEVVKGGPESPARPIAEAISKLEDKGYFIDFEDNFDGDAYPAEITLPKKYGGEKLVLSDLAEDDSKLVDLTETEPFLPDEDADLIHRLANHNFEIEPENTPYSQYQLPGGQNYRELLLTLPMKPATGKEGPAGWASTDNSRSRAGDQNFRSSHYQEPNILAHVRFNERYTSADGTPYTPPQKVLFIEEIQSDWHQKGRKEGYAVKQKWEVVPTATGDGWTIVGGRQATGTFFETKEKAEKVLVSTKFKESYGETPATPGGIPDAPFKTSWPMLAMKRMVRYAAENGFDSVAWTTGEQQIGRYTDELRKNVDSIKWETRKREPTKDTIKEVIAYKDGKDTFGGRINDKGIFETGAGKGKTVEEVLGKNIAKMVMGEETGNVEGKDLSIGGQFHKFIYNQYLPQEVNKFFGKAAWGNARVGTAEIRTFSTKGTLYERGKPLNVVQVGSGWGIEYEGGETLGGWVDKDDATHAFHHQVKMYEKGPPSETVHSLPITPQMREKALTEGMTQFKLGRKTEPQESALADIVPAHVLPRASKAFKGIDRGPILEKIKAGLKEAVKTFTPGREYVAMDPKHFGKAYEILRNFKATKPFAERKALDNLREILDPKNMGKQDYELFTLKIALEDLSRELGENGKYANWQAMVEKYGSLQFGFKSADEINESLSKLNEKIKDNKTVQGALQRRDEITTDLLKSVVGAKLLPEAVLKDRRYFHHQVLEYLNDKFGTGTGSAGLRVGKRGYQFGRIENVKDYSLAYIESEFEVMAHQISQIEKQKNMDEMKQAYDISKRLRDQAKQANYVAVVGGQENMNRINHLRGFIAEMKGMGGLDSGEKAQLKEWADEIRELDPTMPFRQKIAMGYAKLSKALGLNVDEADVDDYAIDMAEVAEYANSPNEELAIPARTIFKAMGERNQFIKDTLGGRFVTETDLMRDAKPIEGSAGYTEWVPNPRSAFFLTGSIQDAIAQQIMAGSRELQASDVRPVLARGRDETWIIPAELAQALESDQFNIKQYDNIVSRVSEQTLSMWKRWILINPLRIVKYNFNNTSGDFDIAFAYDPKIMKYAKQAAADLWRWHYNKEMTPALKSEIDTALRDEVIGSGMTIHDIPDVRSQEGLRQLMDAMGTGSPSALRYVEKFWQGSKNFTTWRENVLRLAAYRHFKEQIAAGKRVYGASIPAKVDAVTDRNRKAALLSRELVGDYGALSQGGQWLRRKAIPFYSWCVPDSTEILTREGWKFRDELRIGEEALTYNIEKRKTEWQPVLDMAAYPFDGDLVTIKNSYGFKYQFTEDHRVVVIEKHKDQRKIVLAKDLKTHQHIPVVAPHSFAGKSILSEKEASLLGWLVTDGYFRVRKHSPKSFEAMLYQKKPNEVEMIRREFADYISTESVHPETGVICFRLKTANLKKIRSVFKSKNDLPGIVTRLGLPECKAMYDAMLAAEGTAVNKFIAFPQNNGPVIDAFQILCYMLGKAGHIRPKNSNGKQQHSLYVKGRDKIQLYKWENTREHYTGTVWCPKTANGTWVMRQDGKMMITGNCEINAPRYWRMYKNLAVEGEPGTRSLRMGAVAAKKTALLSAKVFALYAAAQMFNHLFWPDEEEELGEAGRRQAHVILGRREDGSIITLRLQGALSDALSWLNLHDFPEDMRELATGRKTIYQWLGEGAVEPVNKMVQGIRPDIKAPFELISGRTSYPEFYNPRPIRDKAEYVAQMLSADSLYRRAAGRPLRGDTVEQRVLSDLLSAFTYSADPGETAYYSSRDLVNDYLKEHNLERPMADPTNRVNALYYYKQALKFGDAKAAEKYLNKYKELGGNVKGVQMSVKRAHPLGSLPNAHRARFFNSLDPESRQTIKRGTEWYRETFKGGNS